MGWIVVVPLPFPLVLLGNSVSVSACAPEEIRERSTRKAESQGFGQRMYVGSSIGEDVSGHHKVPVLFRPPNLTRKS